MHRKKIIQRVDFQVALLVTVFVVLSCMAIFYFSYTLSYRQMISSLADRVQSIAYYVDSEISLSELEAINSAEDMNTPAYEKVYAFLSKVREISTSKYLYTTKRNADGQLVYHIDGLPKDDPHFRKPGDLIEPEFQKDLEKALTDTVVMPKDIIHSEWGDVFVAYYPLHDKDKQKVIGAIGIEFTATHEHAAFLYIRNTASLIIVLTCIAAFFVSRFLFRRLSNPHFMDISNTDALTGLKNRNAYEFDIENFIQSSGLVDYALVLADLNCLKNVNDTYGHKVGDNYIKILADILTAHANEDHVSYRIGGDEFAVFFFNSDEKRVVDFIRVIKTELIEKTCSIMASCSVSVGFAFCDTLDLDAWEKTQIKADAALYKDKRFFYEQHQEFNKRKY